MCCTTKLQSTNNSLCSYCPSGPVQSGEAARWKPLLICGDAGQFKYVQLLTKSRVDMCHNQHPKVHHHHRHYCHWSLVIEVFSLPLLGHWYHSVLLKQVGTSDLRNEKLKRSAKTPAGWSKKSCRVPGLNHSTSLLIQCILIFSINLPWHILSNALLKPMQPTSTTLPLSIIFAIS